MYIPRCLKFLRQYTSLSYSDANGVFTPVSPVGIVKDRFILREKGRLDSKSPLIPIISKKIFSLDRS